MPSNALRRAEIVLQGKTRHCFAATVQNCSGFNIFSTTTGWEMASKAYIYIHVCVFKTEREREREEDF